MHSFMMVFSILLQVGSLLISLYYLLIGIFGFIPAKQSDAKADEPEKIHTFALVAAAHNEAAVIGQLVDSLKALRYPKERYDIYIIADNCDDDTAQIARKHGAAVCERFDSVNTGKGWALDWMFRRLMEREKDYDYVCVFDADNLADEDFLVEMNRAANRGEQVIQGYIDIKNPFDSWVTASYALAGWSVNKIFQLPRYRLGLCCQLNGTGFAVAMPVLRELGWGAGCLTEDMEFTMKLAINDRRVTWAEKAVIYDEKPIGLRVSWRQRVRWMQGHCDVAGRYCKRLLKKAVTRMELAPFDCAVYLLQPVRVIAAGITLFFAYAQNFHPAGNFGFVQLSYLFDSPIVWNIVSLVQIFYLPFVVTWERKEFNWRYLLAYLIYPYFNMTWIPICVQGVLFRKRKNWYHTGHTRSLSVGQMRRKTNYKKSRVFLKKKLKNVYGDKKA